MIFYAKNAFVLQWTLRDSNNVSVNVATVTGTLYSNRSINDVTNFPGTPVTPINNVTLTYVGASEGVYQVSLPATLDPPLDSNGNYPPFVLVIDATVAGNPVYHNEEPSLVINSVVASSNDLTTLNAVKSWLQIDQNNTADDVTIQEAISGWSEYVLNTCGIDSFTKVNQYTEIRDGNGNPQMFVRNRPIVNVVSVTVSGLSIPAAGPWPSWGYYISDDLKSIKLRLGGNPFSLTSSPGFFGRTSSAARGFDRGQGNVVLVYNAGYPRVPADLELASRKAVAIHCKRRQTIDQASKSIAAGGTTGTTVFRSWEVPPEVQSVIDIYSRNALV